MRPNGMAVVIMSSIVIWIVVLSGLLGFAVADVVQAVSK